MPARMRNPALVLPDAMDAIKSLYAAMHRGGASPQTLELVHLRASQINCCSACVRAGVDSARQAGETDERLHAVAAWRDTDCFTDAERAALAVTEAATRLHDRANPVSDQIWDELTAHYDEPARAAIILMIATTNFFNRVNITIREPAGTSWA